MIPIPTKRKVDLASYGRTGLLAAFKDRDMPCFSTTSHVEITNIVELAKTRSLSFFITISYVLSRAANQIPEYRHRLINDELYEFERIDPGYTILLPDNSFSFCDSMYFESFARYYEHTRQNIASVQEVPDQTTGDKHHMFFISNVPWFTFTSFTHPYDKQYASIPIVTMGKYYTQGSDVLMPLAVQVHHGLVDGMQVGLLYENVRQINQSPECLRE